MEFSGVPRCELTQAFLEGLREGGYVVGQDLQIEFRYFQGRYDKMPALLAELVASGPEVLVTSTSNSAIAIHTAASTIPMVFLNVADPVALGLVQSLAHPGGNVTGFATFVPEGIIGKHFQFLKELVPQASRIAVLVNPTEKMHQLGLQRLPEAARSLGEEFVLVEASEPDQFADGLRASAPGKVRRQSTSGTVRSCSVIRRKSRGSPQTIDCRQCILPDNTC